MGILASELVGPVAPHPSEGKKIDKRMDNPLVISILAIISVAHTESRSQFSGRGNFPSRAGGLGFGVQS